jgi:hypothetical protein
MVMQISLDLNLHKNQRKVFLDNSKYRLLVASRRFGKSRLLLTEIIRFALSYQGTIDPLNPPVVLLACPTLKQARRIHWLPLLNLLENQPFVKAVNKTDLRIDFHGNKPSILLTGVNDSNGDGIRGLKIAFAGIDEVQDIKQASWEEAISPALADTPGSRALLIGTPKGIAHWLYTDLRRISITDPDWGYHHYSVVHNPLFPKKELLIARRTLSDRAFKQEFMADFLLFEGMFFDHYSAANSIDILPSHYQATYISIDPGASNPAITVIGLLDGRFYVIDSWENPSPTDSVPIEDLVSQVSKFAKQYCAYKVFCPDDRPDLVVSLKRHGIQQNIAGMKLTTQVKRSTPGVIPRIEIANSLFKTGRLLIHSRQTKLISTIQSYRRAKNTAGLYIDKVEEGQDDHLIDSMLYCIGRLEYRNNVMARQEDADELNDY